MTGFHLWFIIILMVISALCLIVRDRRETRHEKLRVMKMREEPFYHEIYTKLCYSKKRKLEFLEITETCVLFRYFQPEPWEESFVFTRYGYSPLSETDMATLALLIEHDYEDFNDTSRYMLNRVRVRGHSGVTKYKYRFIIRSGYKDIINRVPYYSGTQIHQMIIRREY